MLLILFGVFLMCIDIICSSFDSEINSLSSPSNNLKSLKSPEEHLNTPEWLQDIPLKSKVKKYRRRRFTTVATFLNLELIIQIPGVNILGLPTTINFRPIFDFTIPPTNARSADKRAFDHFNRTHFFDQVENFIQSFGFDGRSCLLRTICEVGARPFEHGIIGEALNFLLLSANDGQSIEDNLIGSEYHTARKMAHGIDEEKCANEFPKCRSSLLDLNFAKF